MLQTKVVNFPRFLSGKFDYCYDVDSQDGISEKVNNVSKKVSETFTRPMEIFLHVRRMAESFAILRRKCKCNVNSLTAVKMGVAL